VRRLFLLFAVAACGDGTSHDAHDAHDAPVDPCAKCASTDLCVQKYDGTCTERTTCVPRTVECPGHACTPECEQAYCEPVYVCNIRPACGGESPLAFTCYGP
jgi:hypothetical protein